MCGDGGLRQGADKSKKREPQSGLGAFRLDAFPVAANHTYTTN